MKTLYFLGAALLFASTPTLGQDLQGQAAQTEERQASNDEEKETQARPSRITTTLPPRRISSFILGTDQDAFSPLNEDRNYTMGIAFTWTGDATNRLMLLTPYALHGIDFIPEALGLKGLRSKMVSSSFSFGLSAFTPDSLQFSSVVNNDRPYSSNLYFGSARTYLPCDCFAIKTEFYAGIFGTHIARNVQSAIHYVQASHDANLAPIPGTSSPVPQGWSNQISNGGGIGLLYSFDASKRLFDKKYAQSSLTGGIDLGYYTNANAALNIRLGFIDRAWYTSTSPAALNSNPEKDLDNPAYLLTPSEGQSSEPHQYQSWNRRRIEIFLDAGVKGYAWADNSLLTGRLITGSENFNTRMDISKMRMQHFTGEFHIALVAQFNYLQLTAGFYMRSPELRNKETRDLNYSQSWGRITFGYRL